MATRFFFPETEAAAVSPTISSTDWEHINTLRRRLLATADSSTLTTTAYTPDAADHLVNGDAHHRQYVSDALTAQNVSGTVKGQFQCLEANAANNLFLTLKVYIVSNDGTTEKETLLAITRDTTNELATSLTNRNFPSTAITAADLEAGDRIVVEVGLGGTPTAAGGTQGHNGSIRWGCNASGGDLAENDTETGTTFRGWVEFSDTIAITTVVEADGASAGSATPSAVAAAIWAGVTASTGVAADVVAGAAIWAVIVSAVGTATVLGDGQDGAGGPVEADGSASGSATVLSDGVAIWTVAHSSAGSATPTGTGAAIWVILGGASGSTGVDGVSSATAVALAESIGLAIVSGMGEDAGAGGGDGGGDYYPVARRRYGR